jgi:RNA polymerase sigma-70 factor (ECF subfamily)
LRNVRQGVGRDTPLTDSSPSTGLFPEEELTADFLAGLRESASRLSPRDPAKADEVVQTALARVVEKRGTFDPTRGCLRAWCGTFLWRGFLTVSRAERRHSHASLDGVDPVGCDVVSALLFEEDCIRLRVAVSGLPRLLREALVSRYYSGMTFEAIARACGASASTIFRRVNKALRLLREKLQ